MKNYNENYRDLECKIEVLSQEFRQPVQDCKELWPLDHSKCLTRLDPTFGQHIITCSINGHTNRVWIAETGITTFTVVIGQGSGTAIPYVWNFPRYVNFVDFTVTYIYSKNLIHEICYFEQLEICNST